MTQFALKSGILCGLMVFTYAARAQGYPDSLKMTCQAAQTLVQRHDNIMLPTGEEFAVFTAHTCPAFTTSQVAYVRTLDVRFCYVGCHCSQQTQHLPGSYIQGEEASCKEGATSLASRVIGHTARGNIISTDVPIVCRNGSWVDPEAPTISEPTPSTCKEGATMTSWRPSGHSSHGEVQYTPLQLVCHKNSWVKADND